MNNTSHDHQSAFCLIEVVVALLLFSLSIVVMTKALVETHSYFYRAESEGKIILVAWNIADSLRSSKTKINLAEQVQYWQQILEKVDPQCHITIKLEKVPDNPEENVCYAVQIQSGNPIRRLDFQVLTQALIYPKHSKLRTGARAVEQRSVQMST